MKVGSHGGVSTRTKLLSTLGVIAAGVVALLLNVLAARHYRRWDATHARLYSLSDPTTFTLDSMEKGDQQVELFVFIGAGDPLLGSIKQLLTNYQARAPRTLHVRYLDPDRDRIDFLRLQTELEVNATVEQGRLLSDAQIVARRGKRVWYVKTGDLMMLEEGDDTKVRPRAEEAITSSIRAVLSTDRPRLCFVGGHHEAAIDDPGEKGLSTLKNKLLKDNFDPVAIDATKPGVSYAGCALIAIVQPSTPFTATETKPIVDAVTAGAALLLVVPPEIDVETKTLRATGLAEVAALGGVTLEDAVVVEQDPALREPNQHGIIFRARTHPHETTDDLRKLAEDAHVDVAVPVVFGRPLLKVPVAGASAQELLVSSGQSFSLHDVAGFIASREEPKKGGGDRVGPLDLATATIRDKSIGGARVIVVGTSTPFINAAYLDPSPLMLIARKLGLVWLSWLTARPPILDLPPKPSVQIAMHLTDEDISSIGRYVLFLMPFSSALVGGAVWLRRKTTEGKRRRRPLGKSSRKRDERDELK